MKNKTNRSRFFGRSNKPLNLILVHALFRALATMLPEPVFLTLALALFAGLRPREIAELTLDQLVHLNLNGPGPALRLPSVMGGSRLVPLPMWLATRLALYFVGKPGPHLIDGLPAQRLANVLQATSVFRTYGLQVKMHTLRLYHLAFVLTVYPSVPAALILGRRMSAGSILRLDPKLAALWDAPVPASAPGN